ncbi:MAG: family 78 glycoside hydrolase catalytic domain [Erysipelotrichaceae bacterium]|nr:family 78 glycoside hydrolase catalytic domain [Erysipelotrichaceae bacterium]
MKAINIRIDGLKDPLGLENNRPRFTWNCDKGIAQSGFSYSFTVNGEVIYQSEKEESDRMDFVSPIEFHDRDQVELKISLWDENNEKGEETSAFFEMGIHDWKAKWIDPELSRSKERVPASYLKRNFEVKDIGKARLYITSHGLYEVRINGKRVGDFVLAPGTDDYRKRLQYQVYDVKDLLKKGENLIEVIIGDGWYRGNIGIDGANRVFGDDLALLCQLEIDGQIVMISDENWKASQSGPIRFSDMEIGEIYDANLEEFDDYHEVKVVDFPYDTLVCSDEVYIKEMETFEGKRINVTDGSIVYDFSQNLAGYTSFEVNAKKGQKITIWHGELIDDDGNFTQRNIDPGKRNKNGGIPQKIEYTCKDGLNVYKPKFSIFGFQYIKVETDVDLNDAKFKAIAVYSDMEETASFECSDKDVNKLFKNSMWSMKSNFTDIPTDCPHRERSGWTGDAQVFVPTGIILHDSYTVFKKWLAECRIAQKKDGTVANIAPPINHEGGGFAAILDGSTGWGDAAVIVPYVMYEKYGDKKILEDNYGMMVRWIARLEKLAHKSKLKNLFKNDPYKKYVIEKGFHWGEWCQPDVDSATELRNNMTKGAPKSATAYYFYSTKLLSEIAEILGKDDDAKKYRELSNEIRKAYIHTFTDHGLVHSDRQCDYLRAIRFDLVDRKQENAKLLNEMVVKNGYHLNTGFLSTPFLCPVLCEYGYVDTAYRLLLQDSSPSWLYAVKKGSTSIWENWNGTQAGDNASLNHYSYGAVSGWLISGVCGMNVENGTLEIRPYPNRMLEYAKGEYQSPLGLVKSNWKHDKEGIEFEFEIPANVHAKVILPDGSERILDYGKHVMNLKGEF